MRFIALFLVIAPSMAIAEEITKLPAVELSVQTHKWDGKKVETRMSCFYADKDDYRCTGGRARVDFHEITNLDGRKFLEENCDTLVKSDRPRCTVTLRFVYKSNRHVDIGLRSLTLVKSRR